MNAVVRDFSQDLASGLEAFLDGWRRGWTVPEPLSLAEWADRHRLLTAESSAEPGRWRTDRTPYLREIMEVLSNDSDVERIVFMKGTQVGGTEIGNCWVGYIIHHAPAPLMVVQPTVDVAKRWSRQRLTPMIEAMPELRSRIAPPKSRDSANTTLLKEFPGGFLVVAGANSAAGLRSMPVKYLFLDEVDAYPEDVDGEGSPIDLAERRTSTFARRKIFLVSTPTIKDCSVIEAEYERSDQRRYHVPCPHCEGLQVLRDEQLTANGTYLCEHCGREIEHRHKTWMLAHGRWIPKHPERRIRGYHLSSLYAPLGLGYTWAEIVQKREEAGQDPAKLKAYVNTILGLPFADEQHRLDWQELMDRAESWKRREIPPGCLLLTCGVDVQDDRLAVLLVGWGRGERSFIIDWLEIPGNPAEDALWAQLDRYLATPIHNTFDIAMTPVATAVDTGGHHTHTVYNYCRLRRDRLVLAVRGATVPGRPIIAGRPRPQDVNTKGGVLKNGVDLWTVGTDTAKGLIYARLATDAGRPPEERKIHFPADLGEDFYRQLTADVYDPEKRRWRRLPGRREEVLDCFCYAYAAACHPLVRVHLLRDQDWDRIEDQVQPKVKDLFAGEAAPPEPEAISVAEGPPEAPSRPARRSRRQKRNFVGGWK